MDIIPQSSVPSSLPIGLQITPAVSSISGVLFADAAGKVAVDTTTFGLKWLAALEKLVVNIIETKNGVLTDSVTGNGGTLTITASALANLVITSSQFLQYVAATHRLYSPGFVTNPLEVTAAEVFVTADAALRCDKAINLKSTGANPATPAGTQVNLGFKTIAGVRTPVFVGSDGTLHTITFV